MELFDEDFIKDYERKQQGLESILGKIDDMDLHSSPPYYDGGQLDIYVFPNHIPGTGFASMELTYPDGSGQIPNQDGLYEVVMFTKLRKIALEQDTPYKKKVLRCREIMTMIGEFSKKNVLDSGQTCTCHLWDGKKAYLFLNQYGMFPVGERIHHLMLIMEIFENEQNYVIQEGTVPLIAKLKEKDYYPYSDLDREPVV